MSNMRTKIPGRLESAETGNIVTGADAVMDDARGKTQYVVNNELEGAILQLGESKQNKMTFDSAPTEGSPNPVTSGGVYTADQALSAAIEAILLLIPSAASALNQLADKNFVNSSIATDTATFMGTYNLVSDLHLGVSATHEQIEAALDALSLGADNNDYAFVQIPNTDTAPTEIVKTERYKFDGTGWSYEYDLNNSGFTSDQWAAINSGITTLLVSKLSALPTSAALASALAGKQDVLTFDNVPTAGSPNPVKSGGVYTKNNEIVALINALDAEKQDVLTFDTTPTSGSTNPVTSNGIYLAISLVQSAVVGLDGRMGTAENNIVNLQAAYAALTQSDIVVVEGALPSTGQQINTIYRQPDPDHTPPQYYSDYMWNGTAWVLMATYNNAIDDEPTAGSNNLVKSGGVFDKSNPSVIITTGPYLLSDGTTKDSGSTVNFGVTDYYAVRAGITVKNCKPASASASDYTYICFYDRNFQFVGRLSTPGSSTIIDHTIISTEIPSGAVYFRATVRPGVGKVVSDNLNLVEPFYESITGVNESVTGLRNDITSPVQKTSGFYLKSDGGLKPTTVADFNISDLCPVKAGIALYELHAASNTDSDMTYVAFYDSNLKFVGRLTGSSTNRTDHVLAAGEIPAGAVYFRACLYDSGYVDYRLYPQEKIQINETKRKNAYDGILNYETALAMDKNVLVQCIEAASNGRCTAIFDNDGYPSLMYKIPKIAIGALDSRLGDLNTAHPAFICNSVEKDCIYMSVFHTSVYNGHYVSWFGLTSDAHINIDTLRTGISGKGTGWHLETIFERSLLSHLARKFNSPKLRGNTKYGMSSAEGYEHEQVQLINGYFPGSNPISHTGVQWFNGTQPASWSHNGELWGIQDVIGAFHEICDLIKVVNGHIYLATDNKYFTASDSVSTFENSWVDTGATYDYVSGAIQLSNTITGNTPAETYSRTNYADVLCSQGYDSLSLNTRKLLGLLFLSPRLSSGDANPLYDVNGSIGVRNHDGTCHGVFGGAEEYGDSGLGYSVIGFDLSGENVAHWNMGSRICFIE